MSDKVTIGENELAELRDASHKFHLLERQGVDNWDGWDDAMGEYHKAKEREVAINMLLADLMETLGENIIEPAEHGCGFGYNDDAARTAYEVLRNGIDTIIKEHPQN